MARFSLALALLIVAFGAALAAQLPTTASAQQGVCQPNPSPVDSADPSMIVSSPTDGASVTSPLTVTGQARTFEATVQVALFDTDGNEIASTFGTAGPGEIGVLLPFSIDITFSVAAPTEACLWVFEDSAETGEPVNVVQVPLTLQPTAALPTTGSGGGGTSDLAAWVIALAATGMALSAAGWALRRRTA